MGKLKHIEVKLTVPCHQVSVLIWGEYLYLRPDFFYSLSQEQFAEVPFCNTEKLSKNLCCYGTEDIDFICTAM